MFFKKNSLNKSIDQIQSDLDELRKEPIEKNKVWISENMKNLTSKAQLISVLYQKNVDNIEKYHRAIDEFTADHLKPSLSLINEILNSLNIQKQNELLPMQKKVEEVLRKINGRITEIHQQTIQIQNNAKELFGKQKLVDAIKIINEQIILLKKQEFNEGIEELGTLRNEIESYMMTISTLATKFVDKQKINIQSQLECVPPDQVKSTIREIFETNIDNFQFLLKLEKIQVPPKEMLVDYCMKIYHLYCEG